MRFNNHKTVRAIPYLCFFLLMGILLCVFLKVIWIMGPEWFYVLSGLALVALLYIYAKANYFAYDSSGGKMSFQNKKAIRRFYLKRKNHSIEFDKIQLKRYTLKNYVIYKFLVLYVSILEKKEEYKKSTFDITFLNIKKTKLLKQSLDKVLNSNTATV